MLLIGIAAALLACAGYGTASVLQAYGARESAGATPHPGPGGGSPSLRSTIAAILTPAFIAGIALDGLGFIGSLVSARLIPLFLSQTIISANLVVTALLSTVVLKVRLHAREWGTIAVVVVALCVLGLSAGKSGGDTAAPAIHWGVLVASGVVLAAGVGLIRALGSRAAIPAGLIAGVLYGAMAIAVRVVSGLEPFDLRVLLTDPAFWAIILAGLGGFYLFTVALQLGSVNGTAAALVVGETVVPGVAGVALLGDSARSGLSWLVALAFVAAVAGAVAVAIFGTAEHPEEPVTTG